MRVLLSAYACRPNAGSEPGVGWNWATHLAARGFEVHVLVAKRNQAPIESSLSRNPIPKLHFSYVSVPYQWAKKSEALHYALWQFAALKVARELAGKMEFHLAHHVTYASIHVPSQLWRLGIPVIFGPVGGGQTAPASMLRYFGRKQFGERVRTSITKSLSLSPVHRGWLRRMSVILAANTDTLSIVRALGCNNASLMCDTSIPTGYFAEGPRTFEEHTSGLRLLWVGRMLPRKALPLALDALAQLHHDVKLTIAGDGLDPETLHEMVRVRNLQQRVFWKGTRLTFQELRKSYAEHDAMLFTSLRDAFGSQVLEAMAMGLPIITLDLHGAHDFVPENAAFKVPVGNPDETVRNLANAIQSFALLPAASRNQMSRYAWNFAKTLTWPGRVETVARLYERVFSRTRLSESASTSKVAAEAI